MRLMLFLAALAVAHLAAAGDRAGDFDYYVAALSWNAAWCAREGDARGAAQCAPSADLGFTLHGLWPQYERGWPSDCATEARDPTRRQTAAMADVMGSAGLARHEWRKHGRCSGLSASAYFALSREAWRRIARPAALRALDREIRMAPAAIEAAFLDANPEMTAAGVTAACRDGALHEVRVCLTRDLAPRACSGRVARDCPASAIRVPPMR